MAQILNTVYATVPYTEQVDDGQGGTVAKETQRQVVREVTFMLDRDVPHTLTFQEKGTVIKDGNGASRTVGEGDVAYHEFTDPQEAVQAYLDGKV